MIRQSRDRHPRPFRVLFGAALLCAVSGCVLGPDYARPPLDVPADYRYGAMMEGAAPIATLPAVAAWWQGLGDPELDALVQEALDANHDLRIAASRVEEFAARVTSTHAQGLPQVGYAAGAGRQRAGPNVTASNFSSLLSASWELDLWGRLRREDEAARANLLGSEQARLGVALTLVSAVVASYVTLLDFDRRLEIAQATLAGRDESVDLFQMRLDGGAVSEFEMALVTAEYESAASAIPELQQAITEQEHALSLLLGRNPGPIRRGSTLAELVPTPVPAGLPSDLIARRPDILQSEQNLVAANALVGAARALYFPQLSLTGAGGHASSELDELFAGDSRIWSFSGQLLGPIFSAGAIQAANEQADARRDQALFAYQKTVQSAFRDVDDALSAIATNDELVGSLGRRVAALRRAVELARERYDNGYTDYLDVLDAERALFAAELGLTAAFGDGHRARIDLYRALGGDWIGAVAPPSPVAALAVPAATATAEADAATADTRR